MELDHCSVCFNEYHEEACVPKVVSECGHSFCEKCLTSILQSQKSCPKCRATLSRSIEEYPTNFDLLTLSQSSKGKSPIDFEDPYSLESLKKKLNRQKQILKELMAERDSIAGSLDRNKDSVERTKASTQKLLSCAKIMFEPDEIADLVQDIEECLEEVNKSLHYSLGTHKDLLRLKDFENSKQYLRKIAHQLQNGKRVYACKRTDDLEEWKYGEVTCSENLLHIHSLSSSGFEPGASLVLFKDVTDCITSREDILPFIEFGSQKLRFTLTEDSSIDALRFLKFCTGEEGRTIKGRNSRVGKWKSENLNFCEILIPTKEPFRGYEKALYQEKRSEAKKGEVTLHCEFNRISINEWAEDGNDFNPVGKLHENFKINFDQIQKEPKVTDSEKSEQ